MRTRLAMALAVALAVAGCNEASSTMSMAGAADQNATCAGCHPTQGAQFAESRHASATASETFQALRATATTAQQGFCDSCHAPHDEGGVSGVGCVTCHTAVGNANVSNAQMLWDPSGPMRGPIADPVASSAHASLRSEYVSSADLCGTCHEVHGPGAFSETPYTEWSQSPAAAAGVACASCHMSPDPGNADAPRAQGPAAVFDGGAPARRLSDHRFIGPDDDGAAGLLSHAADLTVTIDQRDADGLHLTAAVTNRNAAHALPSGARFAREMWLEVSVRTSDGTWTAVSGALDARGAPVAESTPRVDFGDEVTHAGLPALPTQSDPPRVRALEAGATVRVGFLVPASIAGLAADRVRARLRYRPHSYALRAALSLSTADLPVFDLAASEAAN